MCWYFGFNLNKMSQYHPSNCHCWRQEKNVTLRRYFFRTNKLELVFRKNGLKSWEIVKNKHDQHTFDSRIFICSPFFSTIPNILCPFHYFDQALFDILCVFIMFTRIDEKTKQQKSSFSMKPETTNHFRLCCEHVLPAKSVIPSFLNWRKQFLVSFLCAHFIHITLKVLRSYLFSGIV